MTTPLGYSELVQCPYEAAHRIQPEAMSRHLFKCRKNHPNKNYGMCPYNASHRVRMEEFKYHSENCEDRAIFELYKFDISTGPRNVATQPEIVYNTSPPKMSLKKYRQKKEDSDDESEPEQKSPVQDDDENWDDMNEPAYDPQEYARNANVIRKSTLMAPSQKTAFYGQESLRLKSIKIGEPEEEQKEKKHSQKKGKQNNRGRKN